MNDFVFSQNDTSVFKVQFGLGVNNPSKDGFIAGFERKAINFPTVNLGAQYMFTRVLGAKLDYGFSRISNKKSAQAFKVNYSRINLQAVFDATRVISISNRIGVFFHAGPGFSNVKPLGDYPRNKASFLNAMGGVELHYGISNTLSIYTDLSYIHSFAKAFDPVSSGFGSFNGNLLTVTFGASISLSGCYFCERE